jgi:hypothetical protein
MERPEGDDGVVAVPAAAGGSDCKTLSRPSTFTSPAF